MTGSEADPVALFEAAGGHCKDDFERRAIGALHRDAPSYFMLICRHPTLFLEATERPITEGDSPKELRQRFDRATKQLEDSAELKRILRRLRHQTVLRVAVRELLALEDIDTTSAQLADLASAAVDAAVKACRLSAKRRHGPLLDRSGKPVPLAVLGMGKLGGRELNLGSDIDLCFFYGTDDASTADGTTAYPFFSEVVTGVSRAIGEVTEDGFVFRVDLRLRPEGSQGPVAMSHDAALRYYESIGQSWERVALLRARPVAGHRTFGRQLLRHLEPFVYRKSVDPSIASMTRRLVEASRRELREDPALDLKVGRGGIREAEFFVQTLQLIWGGRYRKLRVTRTMEALERLQGMGLVTGREAEELAADWAFLRRLEHRLHLTSGVQTHQLPSADESRARIGNSLGFDSAEELDTALEQARERVRTLFDNLELGVGGEPDTDPALEELADRLAAEDVAQLSEQLRSTLAITDVDAAVSHLQRLSARRHSVFGPATRARYPALAPLLLFEVQQTSDPDAALKHLSAFFGRLGGNWGFERLLTDHPRLTRRIVGLFGTSEMLSRALVARPSWAFGLLGATELIDEREIGLRHKNELPAYGEQEFADSLRRLKTEITLELGIGYIGGELSLDNVQRRLSALAVAQVTAALSCARQNLIASSAPESASRVDELASALVVVGLGKLGGNELGFSSDLDLLFLYDGSLPLPESELEPRRVFTRLAQETMQLVSLPNAEGPGYEVDLRLRPGGSQGLLVVSMDAFARYHASRSDDWERLALVRSRPIAGSPTLFPDVRRLLLQATKPTEPVDGRSIAKVRRRAELELAQEKPTRYHAKVGYGAMLDAEFIVQLLQLRHGQATASDEKNVVPVPISTLMAIDELEERALLPSGAAATLRAGYRFFRSAEQSISLIESTSEARINVGGHLWHRLASQLSVRDRDHVVAAEVLTQQWQEHANRLRNLFEELVGPVGLKPPWETREVGST